MAEYIRKFERTFSAGDAPLLRIANRRGELTVRGVDRSDIVFSGELRVEAGSRDEAEERSAAVDLPMAQHDETVEIGPPEFTEVETISIFGFTIPAHWRGPRIDMVVEVPRNCRVQAELRTGSVRIEGINADVRIDARTGRVRVAEIEGELEIEARTGSVEVHAVRGGVRVETRTGRIEVADVTGDTRLSTRTGRVQARDVSGVLRCRTRTGAIRVLDCDGPFDLATTTGVVEYRGAINGDGTIDVRTGRITLAVPRGASFFIDAAAERGSVRSELDVDDLRKPQEGAPTVRLRSRTGSIRIVPAAIAAAFAGLGALAALAPLGGLLTL